MKAKKYITPDIRKVSLDSQDLLGESLGRSETKVTNDNQVFSRRSSFWDEECDE